MFTARTELVTNLHRLGAEALKGEKIQTSWGERAYISVFSLGLWPLVDSIRKLFDRNYLSAWERASYRKKFIVDPDTNLFVMISSPGNRPLSESLILFQVGEGMQPQIQLVPRNGQIVARHCEWVAGRGLPSPQPVGTPTLEELMRFNNVVTAAINFLA
ncbi:MAG: hypothetical protein PHE48_04040 [Candidatus Daviesbacteria bacterium]|nr:hypothetical protein [Candidatus Daviesbacteria bacterium]